jgi:hypothetical protein
MARDVSGSIWEVLSGLKALVGLLTVGVGGVAAVWRVVVHRRKKRRADLTAMISGSKLILRNRGGGPARNIDVRKSTIQSNRGEPRPVTAGPGGRRVVFDVLDPDQDLPVQLLVIEIDESIEAVVIWTNPDGSAGRYSQRLYFRT